MIGQEFDSQRIQSRTNRRDLRQYFHTVTPFIGHPLDAGDLSCDPVEPRF